MKIDAKIEFRFHTMVVIKSNRAAFRGTSCTNNQQDLGEARSLGCAAAIVALKLQPDAWMPFLHCVRRLSPMSNVPWITETQDSEAYHKALPEIPEVRATSGQAYMPMIAGFDSVAKPRPIGGI